jgi:hypothetical protein
LEGTTLATVIYGTMAIIIFILGFFFIGPTLIHVESLDAIVFGWLTFPVTLKLEWIIFKLWRDTPEGQVVIAKFKETI